MNIINNRDREYLLSISLGSKSSAILTHSTGIIIAQSKEERITKKKNDSSFPMNSINKVINKLNDDICFLTITISHWFNSNHPNKTWERYYVDIKEYLKTQFPEKKIVIKKIITSNDLHDCLMSTAKAYYLQNYKDNSDVTFIVMNRFGNYENVLSIYDYHKTDLTNNLEPYNIKKIKDLNYSLAIIQQHISKLLDYNEYDIYDSALQEDYADFELLNIDHFKEVENKHDNLQNINTYLEGVNKKDIYDYRPIDVAKLEKFISNLDFSNYDRQKLIHYLFSYTYTVIYNLIKSIDNKIILVGDCFISKTINDKLKKDFDIIVCPYKEDNCAIFGAANKILEKIFYTRIKLDKEYLFIDNDFKFGEVIRFKQLDIELIVKYLEDNYIVNLIDNKTTFYEDINHVVSLCNDNELLLEINSFNKNRIINEYLLKGFTSYSVPLTSIDNISPRTCTDIDQIILQQQTILELKGLSNKIITFIKT